MQKRNKKKMVIGILCCMLVFMGIGYAALSQVLNIGTTAKVTGSWNVYISSATVKEKSDADMNGTEIGDNKTTDISLNVSFKKPSDYITYDITVENAGTIDAKLDEITMTPPSNVIDGTEEKMFLMETQNLTKGSVLKAGGTTTFQMTLRFNEKATALPSVDEEFTFGLKLNYVQLDSADVDTSGTGGGTTPAETPNYTVTDEGLLIGFNPNKLEYDNDGYLLVPANNEEGKPIKKISRISFSKYNVLLVDNQDREYYVITDNAHFKEIKEMLLKEINTDSSDSGSGSGSGDTLDNLEIYDTTQIDFDKTTDEYDSVYWYHTYYFDYKNGTYEETRPDDFQKIDLTNAINIREIDSDTFNGIEQLTDIRLNNGLQRIGNSAFFDCNLTSITLPSSITTIESQAFYSNDNNLKTITIKRANSDGMTLGGGWNGNATVVYDPS